MNAWFKVLVFAATLLGYSGRETAIHYREMAADLWRKDIESLVDEPGSFPFFLLHDPGRDWNLLGDDPVTERFKAAFRIAARFQERLVPPAVYGAAARSAESGFFRYRRDLKKDQQVDWKVTEWGFPH